VCLLPNQCTKQLRPYLERAKEKKSIASPVQRTRPSAADAVSVLSCYRWRHARHGCVLLLLPLGTARSLLRLRWERAQPSLVVTNQRFGWGSCFRSLQEYVRAFPRAQLHKKVSLKSEDMSNAAQCRTAGQQDEHKIPADRRTSSSSSSSRQADCLWSQTDSHDVSKKVYRWSRGNANWFRPRFPMILFLSRRVLIPFWKFHHPEKKKKWDLEMSWKRARNASRMDLIHDPSMCISRPLIGALAFSWSGKKTSKSSNTELLPPSLTRENG
jgi:hypothetical protein